MNVKYFQNIFSNYFFFLKNPYFVFLWVRNFTFVFSDYEKTPEIIKKKTMTLWWKRKFWLSSLIDCHIKHHSFMTFLGVSGQRWSQSSDIDFSRAPFGSSDVIRATKANILTLKNTMKILTPYWVVNLTMRVSRQWGYVLKTLFYNQQIWVHHDVIVPNAATSNALSYTCYLKLIKYGDD